MDELLISINEAEHYLENPNFPKWKKEAVTDVRERILHKDYPCVFTRAGYDKNHLMFTFIEYPFNGDMVKRAFNAIEKFIALIGRTEGKQAAALKTLMLCVDCTNLAFNDEPKVVWHLLNEFLRLDDSEWPKGIPKDPDNPEWAYCLLGKRAFITVLSPSHKKRHSRNIGSHMVLLFQLRDGIEHVAPYNAKGDDVREVIRQRIEAYDVVPLAPDMTTHGEGGNKDWTQYWLGDGMDTFQGKCPLHQKD